MVAQALRDFKTSTIDVYDFKKVFELVVVYMGTVLFLFFFNRSIQYSWLFLNKTFLLISIFFFLLVCIIIV